MRGWTAQGARHREGGLVFPAHAGMDRRRNRHRPRQRRVPRACGDGPLEAEIADIRKTCSPRMRGWTERQREFDKTERVFPAHAGMDRSIRRRTAS